MTTSSKNDSTGRLPAGQWRTLREWVDVLLDPPQDPEADGEQDASSP